jgi:GNAT superfamily N-acetyltransferase
MLQAAVVNAANVDKLASLYEAFSTVAQSEYRWDIEPIPFAMMRMAIKDGILSAILVEDTSLDEPVAMMLYRLEPHRAIEINVIYVKESHQGVLKSVTDRMMRCFVEKITTDPNLEGRWDVVSYAMLGAQESLIRTITWYGFKPLGQAILKFNVMDEITIQILMLQKSPELPEGYSLDSWKSQYTEGVAQTLFEAFSKAPDALWDPRFRTLEGTRGIVNMVVQGDMGRHIGDCTTVLLKDNEPIGICFLLEANLGVGNIPLVGLRPSESGKKLGNLLLKSTLDKTIKAILDESKQFGMLEINATMETDNFAAIRMYRRMGFVEEYNYPHVYLEVDRAKKLTPGKWCSEGGGMA